ncbi:lytic transglycosylase domain-containing protein [Thioalkalivibrio sp.]|uniref:lytic transglycosylase domain-containing protein n=1 Tax=Thioalkalivibrio sp. TaxID=2093813 RepID=UPI00397618E2
MAARQYRQVFATVCVVGAGLAAPVATGSAVSLEDLFDTYAQHLTSRALAHEHGEGVARDPLHAAELYCEAARLGHSEAMFALGWMYANGRGLPRSDRHAHALFHLAAERGNGDAERTLQFIRGDRPELPTCMFTQPSAFADGPWSLEQRLARFPPQRREIARLIVSLSVEYDVSPVLALAVALTESALNPTAVSPKDAMGVMQLIPKTAARFQVADVFDPEENIRGGLAYLRWLLAHFEGNVELALAAYNAGEEAVAQYGGIPPFRETQDYVQRIQQIIEQPTHPYDSRVAPPSAMFSPVSGVDSEATRPLTSTSRGSDTTIPR